MNVVYSTWKEVAHDNVQWRVLVLDVSDLRVLLSSLLHALYTICKLFRLPCSTQGCRFGNYGIVSLPSFKKGQGKRVHLKR